MWIASKYGFYSIVQTRENKEQFMVRARAKKDLENLKINISDFSASNIIEKKKCRLPFQDNYFARGINQIDAVFCLRN